MIILNKDTLQNVYNMYANYNCNSYSNFNLNSKKGKVIIAPPASGKTFFVKNQFNRDIFIKNENQNEIKNKNQTKNEKLNIDNMWFDMDSVFWQLNFNWQEHESDAVEFKKTYKRADYLIEQCTRLGFNLLGCLYYSYRPDAIVLLPKDQHLIFLKNRSDLDNRKHIIKLVEEDLLYQKQQYNIPTFTSVIEAVNYLELKIIKC